MEKIVLVVHLVTALAIIGLILLQQGKGAEAGASFGAGASQTVFGSQGGGNFFTRATAVLATVFFVTSFGLAIIAKQQASVGLTEGIPVVDDAAAIPAAVESSGDFSDTEIPYSEVPESESNDSGYTSDIPESGGVESGLSGSDAIEEDSSDIPQ